MCTSYEPTTAADVSRLLGRRGFLRAGAAAALGLAAAGLVRGAPASASQVAADRPAADVGGRVPSDRVSIQLYSLRGLLDADLDAALRGLAGIGFPRVEHAGFHGRDAAAFRERLDAAGLAATSGHQGLPWPWDELRWRRTVDAAYTVGQRAMVEPLPSVALPGMIVPESARLSPSVLWGTIAENLNEAAAIARTYGIEVGYHNHDVELRPLGLGQQTAYDILLAETDPELVHFEMDIYWVWRAEVDPVDLLEAHGPRFRRLHVKDMAPDGSITFPGEGLIDFARVFAAAEANGAHIEDYIIEQDNAGAQGMRCAQLGFELLRDIRW
jgi:sugar phosphate isomerase/epimerase